MLAEAAWKCATADEPVEHNFIRAHALAYAASMGVDMETAAVAQAATRMDVPWAAIKATSDNANGDSAGDFQTNLKRAARIAADATDRMILAL